MTQRVVLRRLVPIVLLAQGLGLIYWGWQPRGREEALALGMVLVLLAVPLLLYAVTRARR